MAKAALLIGVSEYQPGLNPLPAAVQDVEAVRRVLVNPEMGGFADNDVTVLKNPQPQDIRNAIYDLFANRQKDDLLLFYFSGHGIKDDRGNLYFATRDTRKDNGKLVTPLAVAARTLHENINDSRSQRQVIILDCCFSGAIAQGMTVKDDGTVNVEEQLGGKGRAILTSSTSTQYSFEQEGSELSIYTRYLVEGVNTGVADKDGDGWISIDELHEYAKCKVQETSPAMTPEFYPVKEGHKILLAKSPKDDPKLVYRQEVESRAQESQGAFSIFALRILEGKRKELNISPEEANAIKEEVLQPYREYERKRYEYEQALIEAVKKHYPFSETLQGEIKEYQQYLGLRDEDIAAIEQRVFAPKQTEYERQQEEERLKQEQERAEYQEQLRQQEEEAQQRLKYQTQQAELQRQREAKFPSIIQTQPFEFDTATLTIKTITEKRPRLFGFLENTLRSTSCDINRSRGGAESFQEDLGNGVFLEMVKIPGGSFLMGSPESELERLKHESPQHKVNIQPFFMGKFLITQEQYQAIMGENPSKFKGKKKPVECVSWYNAVEFGDRISKMTGRTYRLPSEAEWEYACRAGTTTPFHFGDSITTELVNYDGNYTYGSTPKGEYRKQTTDVGNFPANAFGLYDMHGNVWEWCQDSWHKNYQGAPNDGTAWVIDDNEYNFRLLRGGSWDYNPSNCRCTSRLWFGRVFRSDSDVGFRVVFVSPRAS